MTPPLTQRCSLCPRRWPSHLYVQSKHICWILLGRIFRRYDMISLIFCPTFQADKRFRSQADRQGCDIVVSQVWAELRNHHVKAKLNSWSRCIKHWDCLMLTVASTDEYINDTPVETVWLKFPLLACDCCWPPVIHVSFLGFEAQWSTCAALQV